MARKSSASDNGSSTPKSSSKTPPGSDERRPLGESDARSGTSKKKSTSRGGRRESNAIECSGGSLGASRMVVNYIPGDECRIAFVDQGKLEEYHAEPVGSVSRVNNIYLGVVRSVNTAVQAAFVDFGLAEHGFLHTTDVHPRYFPKNADAAERVGLKTPRRDRPPIQKCFKPGDRVMVQVLKEGVGTKGPTLTSYISIPGRYLVMMPGMDNVGVSRKVEDEQTRRQMRQVLDQLDLPEGFGFILRTAGLERTKTELNKDLAYLKRLWADMEKKQKAGKAPMELYAESDLLLRALRDLAGSEVKEVIIDDLGALARAERFLKIAAPRSRPRLLHYTGKAPIFAAFGIEQQIQNIYSREVPLPSGGRLIFEETEALVAIDVNSGRSRSAKDAETNALNTNLEAADEICRQLRLRDMGGLVVNDLIDMRHARNRKAVEQRFVERLKRDRAKSTILPISEFGILEMTRQRMRSSHERTHFTECHLCKGRGVIRRPDSVAAEALRELALVASHDKVARVEMVVSAQVASHLLSGRRKQLSRIERQAQVITEVRVSETMSPERFVLHAYEHNGNDINLDKLPKLPDPERLLVEAGELDAQALSDSAGRQGAIDDDLDAAPAVQAHPIELDESYAEDQDHADQPAEQAGEQSGGRRRRRRRRRRGGRGEDQAAAQAGSPDHDQAGPDDEPEQALDDELADAPDDEPNTLEDAQADETDRPEPEDRPRRRRRRRRRRGGQGDVQGAGEPSAAERGSPEAGRDDADDRPDSLARRLASALAAPRDDGRADLQEDARAWDEDQDEDDRSPTSRGASQDLDDGSGDELDHDRPRRRRRRRRRRRGEPSAQTDAAATSEADRNGVADEDGPPELDEREEPDERDEEAREASLEALEETPAESAEDRPRKKRRRRRRRGEPRSVDGTEDGTEERAGANGQAQPTDGQRAAAGLIEPRPARAEELDEPLDEELDEDEHAEEAPQAVDAGKPAQASQEDASSGTRPASARSKPRPRFLYAAHRKTRPGGPAGL